MTRLLPILLLCLGALAQTANVGTLTSGTAAIQTAVIGSGDGPNTWYYSGTGKGDSDYTGGNTTTGWEPHLNGYGASITVAQAGTCTKIAAKVLSNSGSVTFKIALYNGSNQLIANGTAASSSPTPEWVEVTGLSTNVTATSYYILCFADSLNGLYSYDTDANGLSDGTDYGDAPPATASTATETGYLFGVKMYVD